MVEETKVKRLLGRAEPATAAKLTAQDCQKQFKKDDLRTLKFIDLRADRNAFGACNFTQKPCRMTSFVCGYADYTLIYLLVVETSKE